MPLSGYPGDSLVTFVDFRNSLGEPSVSILPANPLFCPDGSIYPASGWAYTVQPPLAEADWAQRWGAFLEASVLMGAFIKPTGTWVASDTDVSVGASADPGGKLLIPSIRNCLQYFMKESRDPSGASTSPAQLVYAQDHAIKDHISGFRSFLDTNPMLVPMGPGIGQFLSDTPPLAPPEDLVLASYATGTVSAYLPNGPIDTGPIAFTLTPTVAADRCFDLGSLRPDNLLALLGLASANSAAYGFDTAWWATWAAKCTATGAPDFAQADDALLRLAWDGVSSPDSYYLNLLRTRQFQDGSYIASAIHEAPASLAFCLKSLFSYQLDGPAAAYVRTGVDLTFPIASPPRVSGSEWDQIQWGTPIIGSTGAPFLTFPECWAAAVAEIPNTDDLAFSGPSNPGELRFFADSSTSELSASPATDEGYTKNNQKSFLTYVEGVPVAEWPASWDPEAPTSLFEILTGLPYSELTPSDAQTELLHWTALGLIAKITLFVDTHLDYIDTGTRYRMETVQDSVCGTTPTFSRATTSTGAGDTTSTAAASIDTALTSTFFDFAPAFDTLLSAEVTHAGVTLPAFSGYDGPTDSTRTTVAAPIFKRKTVQLFSVDLSAEYTGWGDPMAFQDLREAWLTAVDPVGVLQALSEGVGTRQWDQEVTTSCDDPAYSTSLHTYRELQRPVLGISCGPIFAKIEYNFTHYRNSPSS